MACCKSGPRARTAKESGKLFKEQTMKETQDRLYNSFIEYLSHAGFKNPFQLVEKPRSDTMSPVLGAPYGKTKEIPDLRNCDSMTTTRLVPIAEAGQIKEKLVPLVPTTPQNPYWIIVSDEGHAAIPVKHFVKAEAEKEANRLTESRPGITFTVFEAKSSVFTPKAATTKTEYVEPQEYKYVYTHQTNRWGF